MIGFDEVGEDKAELDLVKSAFDGLIPMLDPNCQFLFGFYISDTVYPIGLKLDVISITLIKVKQKNSFCK